MSKPGVAARRVAAELVGRVNRHGAYSNVVTANLNGRVSPVDEGFVRHLVYGVLRNRRRVDRMIDAYARRQAEPIVRDALRVAAFELLAATDAPHAAVDSAVEVVKEAGASRAAGFVNGTLRSLIRQGEPKLPAGVEGRALRYSVPEWLVTSLDDQWGSHETDEFLEASHQDPQLGFRIRAPMLEGGELGGVLDLSEAGYGESLPPGAVVQDPASTAVGAAVAPGRDETVLDMAAAPGGKTLHLYDLGAARVVAADRHARRVARAQRRLRAEGADVPWLVADGRAAPFASGSFDAVLLDAPCSGLGTLRRRPEIRDRVDAGQIDRLRELQSRMLDEALRVAGPSGRVVYSVCTVTAAETVEQVAGRAAVPPDLPGRRWGNGMLLAPHLTGTDGMYISIVRGG